MDDYEEDEDEEDEDMYITNSPEPPEPVEFEGLMQTDEDEQPGRFPPEQDMPFVFTVGLSHCFGFCKKKLFF